MSIPETLEKVLELSRADDCIVIGFEYSTANLRFANNSCTSNGVAKSHELYVVSIKDRRVGVVGKSYFSEDKLEGIVRLSEAAAQQQDPAEDYSPLLPSDENSNNWSDEPTSTDMSQLKTVVSGLAKLFKRAKADKVKLFGYGEHTATTLYLATSTGLHKRYDQQQGSIAICAKSNDFRRSSWTGQSTLDFYDVDVEKMYDQLATRLDWSKTEIELPPGHYETILEPGAVADLLIDLYFASSARDADEGGTLFSQPGGGNKIGQKLFNEKVIIYSDPKEPGFETTPFEVALSSNGYQSIFDNGLKLTKTEWIKDGVLNNLITTGFWGRKMQTVPRPIIGNLIFDHDGPSLDEMIASTKRGLLVTCLWYIRVVDPQRLLLTGLTRDGVFLIEDGQIKGAVNNFRFNMSPVDVLAQTIQIGQSGPTFARNAGEDFPMAKMPPLKVKDFNMSTVSQAT